MRQRAVVRFLAIFPAPRLVSPNEPEHGAGVHTNALEDGNANCRRSPSSSLRRARRRSGTECRDSGRRLAVVGRERVRDPSIVRAGTSDDFPSIPACSETRRATRSTCSPMKSARSCTAPDSARDLASALDHQGAAPLWAPVSRASGARSPGSHPARARGTAYLQQLTASKSPMKTASSGGGGGGRL